VKTCIWYVSKYATLPTDPVGARSFMLMREFVRMGHRALIFAANNSHLAAERPVSGSHRLERVDGVEFCWIRTRSYRGAKSLGRILSWIDFERRLAQVTEQGFPPPDAVIVSSPSLLSILSGLLIRRRYGARLIFEVRDIWPLTLIEEGGFGPRNPFIMALRWLEKLAYRKADLIIGTMPNLQEHVDESVGQRHAPVRVIPFGVDPDLVPDRNGLPAEWSERHLPPGKFVVCHAGTVGRTNALDVLFRCARDMRDRTDVHFLVVGEGDLRAPYEAECADLANVSFTGPVPKEQVQAVLARCDLLFFAAHPSKVWRYGLSLNKIIDYMLAGKPILGCYTGYPNMVEEAGCGLSVPAGDAAALAREIVRLAGLPPEERQAMGARGREWLLAHRGYRDLAAEYLALALPQAVSGETNEKRHVHAG
jgi:glycosyltransferase involved in cell wall biosynthesis